MIRGPLCSGGSAVLEGPRCEVQVTLDDHREPERTHDEEPQVSEIAVPPLGHLRVPWETNAKAMRRSSPSSATRKVELATNGSPARSPTLVSGAPTAAPGKSFRKH